MTTQTLTLTDFLLARIAEDEAVALSKRGTGFWKFSREPYTSRLGGRIGHWLDDWRGDAYIGATDHISRWDPARVVAECEAKRRLINKMNEAVDNSDAVDNIYLVDGVRDLLLEQLALPYADHEDFREEWR